MVIPFPERFSLTHAALFAFALTVGLIASGTGILFSALVFVFVVTAAVGFNIGGGLTRPSGSYVFFFAVLVVIVGLCMKVLLWEPTELLMAAPLTTMSMYVGGIFAMLVSVYLARRFARKDGLLMNVCSTKDMRLAAIGCVIGGVFIPWIAEFIIQSTGNAILLPIAIATRQFNRFLPMAIILGVTYEIKSSGGTRSSNIWCWLAGLDLMYNGFLLGFSKEALFTPIVCWLLSAAALRYRFRTYQTIGIVLFAFFAVYYLVPYCQYGRSFRSDELSEGQRIQVAYTLLSDLPSVREKDRQIDEMVDRKSSIFAFFARPQGFFDRLQMMGVDDKLVAETDEKGTYGLSPIGFYFASIVPKFIWKDKPFLITGNTFAHDIGFSEEDTTTGISFSPVVEGYHEAKWFGVLVVCPLVWLGLFIVMDSLCGDVRKSPWGLLAVALIAHIAPEGMLQGAFYLATYGAFIICVVAFLSAYVMPIVAHFVSPPKRDFSAPAAGTPGSKSSFLNTRPARTGS